jgi:hypothetical protein
MLALLVVTMLTTGGPHYVGHLKITDGDIRVQQGPITIATSHSGTLKKRVRPGKYTVVAYWKRIHRKCEATTVTVKRRGTTHVTLYCDIR